MKLKIFAVVMILTLTLCACSKKAETPANTETTGATTGATTGDTQTTEQTTLYPTYITNLEDDEDEPEYTPAPEETRPTEGTYVVYVIDQDGVPVEGVEVTFETPDGNEVITTDEYGVASLHAQTGDVFAAIKTTPAGYAADLAMYGFDETSLELTITLVKNN